MNEEFKKVGFKIVRNLYTPFNHTKQIPNIFEHMKSIKHTGEMDDQCPFAPSFYRNIEMSKIQIKILKLMEDETGLKLYPTYNYSRIYNKKSILAVHSDRPACEISITLCLGYDGDYGWPIFMKDYAGKTYEVLLKPGDGIIYRGCDLDHWREDADNRVSCQLQVFAHYVDQDGPNADCIFDWERK